MDAEQFEIQTDARPLSKTVEELQGSVVLDGRLFSASQFKALRGLKNAAQIQANY